MADTAAYVEVAGLRTWHEVTGQGEPVVLLHGAFGGATLVLRADAVPRARRATGCTCRSAGATCAPPTWRGR